MDTEQTRTLQFLVEGAANPPGRRATGQATEGIEIRESDRVGAPVTLGIAHPAIVFPGDWREWDGAKLDAVLAHERSHIRRHDPAVQLLSAIHRALLWHSPLSWFLHKRIVRVAEEASDDEPASELRSDEDQRTPTARPQFSQNCEKTAFGRGDGPAGPPALGFWRAAARSAPACRPIS